MDLAAAQCGSEAHREPVAIGAEIEQRAAARQQAGLPLDVGQELRRADGLAIAPGERRLEVRRGEQRQLLGQVQVHRGAPCW